MTLIADETPFDTNINIVLPADVLDNSPTILAICAALSKAFLGLAPLDTLDFIPLTFLSKLLVLLEPMGEVFPLGLGRENAPKLEYNFFLFKITPLIKKYSQKSPPPDRQGRRELDVSAQGP